MIAVSFEGIKTLQHAQRRDELGEHMTRAALQVQTTGADFVPLCTNTMHRVAPALTAALDVPFLHIVDPTAQALPDAGVHRVALLSTAFTMEQDFTPAACRSGTASKWWCRRRRSARWCTR